jgi:hypothetical protein
MDAQCAYPYYYILLLLHPIFTHHLLQGLTKFTCGLYVAYKFHDAASILSHDQLTLLDLKVAAAAKTLHHPLPCKC